VIVAKHI